MAKNPHKEAQKKLVWRTNKYASKVGKLYSQAVNDLLDVTKKVNTAAKKGEMFSYEDNPEMAKAASDILRRLHSDTYAAVKHGIQLEWAEGNKAADQFLATHFGKQVLNDPNFAAWTSRNTDALEAFFKRTRDDGMTLSKRIWKQTKQLRGEMELAMTVSIGEGESAADISRRVRKYLKDPDKLFRRIKETQEDGSIKWKLSKAAAAYHPGRGMYRSSAKNAMRVARTETNIAYRTADAMRWEEMDFVTGVHVKLSHNHPTADICDVLQGIYPKNFVFKGWHPQCFCYAEPVTASYEDMVASSKAMLAGEQPPAPKDMVTELPDNFKKWVKENQGRIDQAQKNGHLPYFMKDNWDVIYKKSALQKAAERHAARTPEQIEAIKKKFKERQDTYKLGNSILSEMKQIPDIDTSALASALKTPDLTSIKAEAQKLAAIKDEITNLKLVVNPWEEAKTWGYNTVKGIESSVQTKLDSWSGLSLEMQAEKLDFEANKFLGGNMVHKGTGKHIQDMFPSWKVSQNAYLNQLSIVQEKIEWQGIEMQLSGFEASAKTLSSKTYSKVLTEAQDAVSVHNKTLTAKLFGELSEWEQVILQAESIGNFNSTTKSQAFHDLFDKVKDSIDGGKLSEAKKSLSEAQAKRIDLEKRRKTKATGVFSESYDQARKDSALWDTEEKARKAGRQQGELADNALRPTASTQWKKAMATKSEDCKFDTHTTRKMNQADWVYDYSQHYCDVNEPLEKRQYGNYQSKDHFKKKVEAMTSYIDGCDLPCDMWVQRGDSGLDAILSRINFYDGSTVDTSNLQNLVGKVMQEGGFMSTGNGKHKGFDESWGKDVIINIFAPKGTKAAYYEPFSYYGSGSKRAWTGIEGQSYYSQEFETVFQRGTIMKITKVEKGSYRGKKIIYLDVEIIGQEVREISYVAESLISKY